MSILLEYKWAVATKAKRAEMLAEVMLGCLVTGGGAEPPVVERVRQLCWSATAGGYVVHVEYTRVNVSVSERAAPRCQAMITGGSLTVVVADHLVDLRRWEEAHRATVAQCGKGTKEGVCN